MEAVQRLQECSSRAGRTASVAVKQETQVYACISTAAFYELVEPVSHFLHAQRSMSTTIAFQHRVLPCSKPAREKNVHYKLTRRNRLLQDELALDNAVIRSVGQRLSPVSSQLHRRAKTEQPCAHCAVRS